MQRDGGPGGAGGAGNPTGGAFTGPAEALEIVGDHAYCYPGSLTNAGAASADTPAMLFTTGNFYVVCEVSWTSEATGSVDEYVEMFLNGAKIFEARAESDNVATSQSPVEVIIPSYTKFEFKFGFASAGYRLSPLLTGRIYRA